MPRKETFKLLYLETSLLGMVIEKVFVAGYGSVRSYAMRMEIIVKGSKKPVISAPARLVKNAVNPYTVDMVMTAVTTILITINERLTGLGLLFLGETLSRLPR